MLYKRIFFYRKDLVTLKRESIFPIEEQRSYRTAAGMESVAKRPAAGGESCKAGFFVRTAKIQSGGKTMEKRLFTSESVTEGHPDKLCDAVSDAILDALMAQDPMSRVACETAACTGFVLVTGEITTKADIDIQQIVRDTVNEIGYNDAATGFDGNTCAVMVALDKQ